MINLTENSTFYPTPPNLIKKMLSKIKGHPKRALEPSAGKGDIAEAISERKWDNEDRHYEVTCREVFAIEKDPNLQAILREKHIKVIDNDFLTFSGPDKFDLIIANPPFDHGEKHLLKAIDIMYCGQIVFLLNAETIKNPRTHTRTLLIEKLNELNADVEYIENAFKNAERPTGVEIALIYIKVDRNVESDLFAGVDDKAHESKIDINQNHEVSTNRRIEELVLEYNQVVAIATQTILDYTKNYKKVGKYVGLNQEPKSYDTRPENLTEYVQSLINDTVVSIRKDFWRRTLDLPEVVRRLTADKRKEFDNQVETHSDMDFTENNIRVFVLNLIGSYKQTLRDAVLNLFDKFTFQHTWRDVPWEKNIHYFNGWKTNKAFYINKRIVLPVNAGYGKDGPFRDFGRWRIAYDGKEQLRDIDIVMNYFDGMKPGYQTIAAALEYAFQIDTNETLSTYFSKIIAYKKGTLHLTFRDDDILRRFNVEACKGKGWLPENYGETTYNKLPIEYQKVVDSFEGKVSYNQNLGKTGLDLPAGKFPLLEAA